MDLGLFLDLRNPAPWRRPWADHHRRTLELVVEAERLGAGSVWCTEHHLFDDGYLPQPLVMAAALAARTSRLRIGTAVVVAPLRHPRHLAEEAAVVDLISGGRLELGLGAGYAADEHAAFGSDLAERYRRTDATALEVRRLLDDPATAPPPVQRPVPLWLGYQGPLGARRAGRMGMGLLSLDAALLEPYRRGLVEGGHDPASARMAGLVELVVSDDPPAALERIVPHRAHQVATYQRAHGRTPSVDVDELREVARATGGLPGLAVLAPDDAVAHLLERVGALPVAHVYLWASIAGMPDDLVERHVELAFSEVAPRVRQASNPTDQEP